MSEQNKAVDFLPVESPNLTDEEEGDRRAGFFDTLAGLPRSRESSAYDAGCLEGTLCRGEMILDALADKRSGRECGPVVSAQLQRYVRRRTCDPRQPEPSLVTPASGHPPVPGMRQTPDQHSADFLLIARVLTGSYAPPRTLVEDVRKRPPNSPSPGFPYCAEVARLVAILREKTSRQDRTAAVRKIGVELFHRGGSAAMEAAAIEVRCQFPCGENKSIEECLDGADEFFWTIEEIDHAWDGVGSWKA